MRKSDSLLSHAADDLKGIDLRLLRYFLEVARLESFGRAAESLNISQPPLSRAIRELEERMGVTLFLRNTRNVELTKVGQQFRNDATTVLALATRSVERAKLNAQGLVGQLDIGYFGSVVFGQLPSLMAAFHAAYPKVKIRLHLMSKDQQVRSVLNGAIDLGFARHFPQHADLKVVNAGNDPLVFAMPATHALAAQDSVSLEAIAGEPMIVFPRLSRPSFADAVVGLLASTGVPSRIEHEMDDATGCLAMVAAGQGCAIVPQSLAQFGSKEIAFRSFEPHVADSPVSCLMLKEAPTGLASRFVESIQAHIGVNQRADP
ncbi:MAG: LysR family transcriptional regulator [Thalassovita sp.]